MGQYIIWVLAMVAAASWVMAFYNGYKLLVKGRRPPQSILYLLANGWLWFKKDTFLPQAQHFHRRFLLCAMIFGASIMGFIISAIILS